MLFAGETVVVEVLLLWERAKKGKGTLPVFFFFFWPFFFFLFGCILGSLKIRQVVYTRWMSRKRRMAYIKDWRWEKKPGFVCHNSHCNPLQHKKEQRPKSNRGKRKRRTRALGCCDLLLLAARISSSCCHSTLHSSQHNQSRREARNQWLRFVEAWQSCRSA